MPGKARGWWGMMSFHAQNSNVVYDTIYVCIYILYPTIQKRKVNRTHQRTNWPHHSFLVCSVESTQLLQNLQNDIMTRDVETGYNLFTYIYVLFKMDDKQSMYLLVIAIASKRVTSTGSRWSHMRCKTSMPWNVWRVKQKLRVSSKVQRTKKPWLRNPRVRVSAR